MHIHHIAIWTKDIELQKAFYQRYFNCTVGEKYENKEKQFVSYFVRFSDGAAIELMNRPDIKTSVTSESFGYTHIAISCGSKSEVDALTKRMEADGHIVESKPRTTGDGYYESVILDPENNRIKLVAN